MTLLSSVITQNYLMMAFGDSISWWWCNSDMALEQTGQLQLMMYQQNKDIATHVLHRYTLSFCEW